MQDSLLELHNSAPLADRLRPDSLDEYVGQSHLLGEGKLLRKLIVNDDISSMIFWGPPGVGKTTLARIIAKMSKSAFVDFSAVTSGIKEIKKVMEEAEQRRHLGQKTILFVDEIHRFNKAQQDAFLPYVEKGSIILIGATTENPSFEVNSALLSRCKVFVMKGLTKADVETLLRRALTSPKGYGDLSITISDENLSRIAEFSQGDARRALSTLEMAISNAKAHEDGTLEIDEEDLEQVTSRKSLLYDKKGDEHYNIISALHKSMRNSDPDAALYWLARMLEAGEDPLYVARRIVRFASEDVGLAEPRALEMAIAAYQACHYLGMPECSVHLAQTVTFLSLCPKSNSSYVGYEKAAEAARNTPEEEVPLHIRNAPTRLMKELGYGEGYQYAHDNEDKLTPMTCLPKSLEGKEFYFPTEEGLEAKLKSRHQAIKDWKKQHKTK